MVVVTVISFASFRAEGQSERAGLKLSAKKKGRKPTECHEKRHLPGDNLHAVIRNP